MTSASPIHDREGALRQDVWPRGDEYTACVTRQVDNLVDFLNQKAPGAQECYAETRSQIVDISLPKITDLPISERQEEFNKDFAATVSTYGLDKLHKIAYSYMELQFPKLEECMRQAGLPERIVHQAMKGVITAKARTDLLCHNTA